MNSLNSSNNKTEPELTVRKATLADAETLARIGSETFYHTFRPHNTEEDMQAYLAKSYTTELIVDNLHNPAIHYFLCDDNKVCIGYVKLVEGTHYKGVGAHAIELEKIYVLHSYFGSQAAKLLMDQAIYYSRGLGFKHLFLGVWQENKRAISFYEKTGFTSVATRQFKLGETICNDFIMEKPI